MSIYAIGDLHLSLNKEKPMDIFGQNWEKHEIKIKQNWNETVKKEDIVLIPGDLSWEMNIKDMYNDFKYLQELPGKKLLLKGNHDYWWTTLTSMRKFLEDNNFKDIDFVYNNSYEYNNIIIVGTRGWALNDTQNSDKMNDRESERLKISLEDGKKRYGDKDIICLMHYPPINKKIVQENIYNQYIEIMNKYNVKMCLYGHLHSKSHKEAYEGEYKGINFKLVSSDYLNFNLHKVEI